MLKPKSDWKYIPGAVSLEKVNNILTCSRHRNGRFIDAYPIDYKVDKILVCGDCVDENKTLSDAI